MSDIDESRIRQLDGSLLLIFRELLRQRRATQAAERLGLSQSAVSHALSRLRELFGDPLFVRRPHGLEPTVHATELGPRVDELLAAMASALGVAANFDPRTTTRGFRVAAPDHLATLLAPALLADFTQHAPEARFALSQRLGDEALQALSRDEIDLAIGRFGSQVRGFVVERVFDDYYCLVARRGHPALRRGVTRALYARLHHVQISVAGDFRSLEIDPPGERAPARRTVAAVPRFSMAFAVVAQTDAVAIAPHRLARAHAAAFGLSLHELPFRLDPIRVLAVHRPQADPGTLWLIDRVKRALDHGH